jgi:serine-type D-Ala-D-Ala carboxypeptidase/endopeptidase
MPAKKTKKIVLGIFVILFAISIPFLLQVRITFLPKATLISLSEIENKDYEKVFNDFINTNRVPGFVAGVIDQDGTHLYTYGKDITENTLFEIGSITKIFTGMLLADAINTGDVNLEDPVFPFIEGKVTKDLEYYNKITLRNLATHTSGLPYFPPSHSFNIKEFVDDMFYRNFYEDFTKEALYGSLDRTEKSAVIGSEWEYSNVGFGLLGICLSNTLGVSYEADLHEVITEPLGMSDTTIHLSQNQNNRFVPGFHYYNRWGNLSIALKSESWLLGEGLQGAGGIRSTGKDMMVFLQAVLDNKKAYIRDSKKNLFTDDTDGSEHGMGWEIYPDPPENFPPCILHEGSTGGYSSLIVLSKDEPIGFFILTNINVIATGSGFNGLLKLLTSH